jgi:hypothetical protein
MKRVLFSLLLAFGCSGTTALSGGGGGGTGGAPTVPAPAATGGAGAMTAGSGGATAPGTSNPGGMSPSGSGGARADAGGAASGPGPSPSGCRIDADCRLFDDYCKGCDCRALLTTEADPHCTTPGVRCLRQPCAMARAACELGVCKVVRL